MSPRAPILVETEIKCDDVKSLCWNRDALVDIAGGHIGIHFDDFDGRIERARVRYPYRFDRAISLRIGEELLSVLYENRGTKALILKNGEFIREVNRSYYCANAYDYPIALTWLASGRAAVVHCPDDYNRLEVEDAETGARLTTRNEAAPDFFHSRLETSPGGTYLLSGGWIWHPWCTARVFDLSRAIEDPATLDGEGLFSSSWPDEVDSATFSGPNTLVVASMRDREGEDTKSLPQSEIGVWDVAAGIWIARNPFDEPLA